MNCNGVGLNLFIVVLFILILTLSRWCHAMHRIEQNNYNNAANAKLEPSITSRLYEQIRHRLENIENEFLYDIPITHSHSTTDNEGSERILTKRSTIENCLYEELKRRVDKFNNDLAKNPNTALRKHFNDLLVDNEKRSTVRECLYDVYKKRLESISSELAMDGERVFDRSERSSSIIKNTYEDLARRLQLLSQALQPEYNAQQQSADLTMKRRSAPATSEKSSFNYDDSDSLVEDREFDNDDDEEVVYDDDNSRLYMIPISSVDETQQTASNDINSSSYPTVLTKAFESNMSPTSIVSPGNLLASVAQKMNTTTLELAQKLTNLTENDTTAMSHDPNLTAALQNFITRTENQNHINLLHTVGVNTTLTQPTLGQKAVASQTNSPANKATKARHPKSSMNHLVSSLKGNSENKSPNNNSSEEECEEETPTNITTPAPTPTPAPQCNLNPIMDNGEIMSEEATSRITMILEKVLSKLENLEAKKENLTRKSSSSVLEGAPCELLGSWHSLGMGVRFDISLGKATERQLAPAEEGNKLLTISVEECIPPKHKRIVDTDWKFMGSSMQQLGGPFYMYSQRRKDKILATFTGFCRTCGGIDTIFGSWTFLFPSKDCQDISAAIDNRRDVFRRYKMETKRKQRFKELLYKNSKMGKSESCKDKDV